MMRKISSAVLCTTLLFCAATTRADQALVVGVDRADTRLMSSALGRPLGKIIFAGIAAAGGGSKKNQEERKVNDVSAGAVGEYLSDEAQKVVVVPGYGLAVAQAQGPMRDLMDALEADGKKVLFGIHPVAGRMPGHMNVLLTEAGVPYDKLNDLEDINP